MVTVLVPKLSPRRLSIVILGITLGSAGVAFLGCDPMPPIDEHFDSSLGADFNPPPEDAGPDAGSVASELGAP
jgi:hypothetical protein